MSQWRAYFPDDGEISDDARTLDPPEWKKLHDAEDAATFACEHDYSYRDGWERGEGEPFPITIIAPDGTETRWIAHNEASVSHHARPAEDTDDD